MSKLSENEWSQWQDFDRAQIENSVPEAPGVLVSHANMKILKISGGPNLRAELVGMLDDLCCKKSKRFRYLLTQSYNSELEKLIKEFREKHAGKLPECMQ